VKAGRAALVAAGSKGADEHLSACPLAVVGCAADDVEDRDGPLELERESEAEGVKLFQYGEELAVVVALDVRLFERGFDLVEEVVRKAGRLAHCGHVSKGGRRR
jgi:hypothetical protein